MSKKTVEQVRAELDAVNEQLRKRQQTSDQHFISAEQRKKNPVARQKLLDGIAQRDKTYQAESNNRPETKAKISKALKGVPKTNEAKRTYKELTTNKYGNINYETAHKAGIAKRDKPFQAGEYGLFSSIAEAARQVEEKGLLNNAYKKFSKWKKTQPTEYYYVVDKK